MSVFTDPAVIKLRPATEMESLHGGHVLEIGRSHGSYRQVLSTELAGEKIESVLNRAPGNNAAIGGIKVTSASGWFAARPSGTEDIYKIYAESFRGQDHLRDILHEAQQIVDAALTQP